MLYITQLIKKHDMLVSITKTVSIFECLQTELFLPHMFEHKHLTSMVTTRFITFDTKISTEQKKKSFENETREMILFLNASCPTLLPNL